MTYDSIMIDVESLNVNRSAKLLSIGACGFDPTRPPNLPHLLNDTFYVNVGSYDNEKYRDAFSESVTTRMWWERQGEEAKQVLEPDRKDPEEAVSLFWNWVRKHGENVEIWACPPQFDCAIMNNHFDVLGLGPAWHWSKERCYRTMREMALKLRGFSPNEAKAVSTKDKTVVLVKHNALHDAIMQSDKLQQINQYLRR